MPLLVDGNNLIYAMAEVDRELSRAAMVEWIHFYCQQAGEAGHVVFDGPEPPGDLPAQIAAFADVQVSFSGHAAADRIILDCIAGDSAPKRLIVVSTDREIRTAAQRRRCQSVRSEDFARLLVKKRNQPPAPEPVEPEEKRRGLDPEQTRKWMREFGYEPPER
ncbi:MAG: NYN domain-containing protein [Phycisphaerae bacterium]